MQPIPTIQCLERRSPPDWAIKQRALIDLMNEAAEKFVERYTRSDGTLRWRVSWPGMDGSDDGYESFVTFPLLYILGGSEIVHTLARREWNAVTWQFAQYGQVYREFDAYYDWMHHGESYTYLHYLGMADPEYSMDRSRTLKFAAMYTGQDPEALNWDAQHRMIRSPINGSKGPYLQMTAEDWVTHRPVLANYLSPYQDVPGFESDDPFVVLDWNDDQIFARILDLMNERMVPGDVPLNLNATSLVTSAYLYTGDKQYKNWVLEYLAAWRERTQANGGIMPDNIGPNGQIGERMGGRWWGGYYGWRWPHGAWIILESTLIAGQNAMLLTGDSHWLGLHRSQTDLLWSLRREQDGEMRVPYRHSSDGWFDYRPLQPRHAIHLNFMSGNTQDWAFFDARFPLATRQQWYTAPSRFGKAGHFGPERWFGYIIGENPDFPDQVLQDTYQCMIQRLDKIDNDQLGQAESWDVHHWQDLNPVVPEGVMQMTMGTPAAVYHGGLLHATVRYFDPQAKRAGLPPGVAALVAKMDAGHLQLQLVNTDMLSAHAVLVQAGGFGEHQFTRVQESAAMPDPIPLQTQHLLVELGPGAQATLNLGLDRYVNLPSYTHP